MRRYVHNSHPAIVSHEMFDQVQQELARRKAEGRYHRGTSCFAGKLVCECCGEYFGSKTWHSTDKYRKTIWRCNLKYKGAEKCTTPHFTEESLAQRFIAAYNRLLADRSFIIEDGEAIIALLADTQEIRHEQDNIDAEIRIVRGLLEEAIKQNASRALDQAEYNARYQALAARYEKATERSSQLNAQLEQRKAKQRMLEEFIDQLRTGDILTEFSTELWTATVDKVMIHTNGACCFIFKNGTKITV